MQGYRTLALNRGEKLGILKVGFEHNLEKILRFFEVRFKVKNAYIIEAVQQAVKKKIIPKRIALSKKEHNKALEPPNSRICSHETGAGNMSHALEELECAHKVLVAAGCTVFMLRMRRDVEWPGQSFWAGNPPHIPHCDTLRCARVGGRSLDGVVDVGGVAAVGGVPIALSG